MINIDSGLISCYIYPYNSQTGETRKIWWNMFTVSGFDNIFGCPIFDAVHTGSNLLGPPQHHIQRANEGLGRAGESATQKKSPQKKCQK